MWADAADVDHALRTLAIAWFGWGSIVALAAWMVWINVRAAWSAGSYVPGFRAPLLKSVFTPRTVEGLARDQVRLIFAAGRRAARLFVYAGLLALQGTTAMLGFGDVVGFIGGALVFLAYGIALFAMRHYVAMKAWLSTLDEDLGYSGGLTLGEVDSRGTKNTPQQLRRVLRRAAIVCCISAAGLALSLSKAPPLPNLVSAMLAIHAGAAAVAWATARRQAVPMAKGPASQ